MLYVKEISEISLLIAICDWFLEISSKTDYCLRNIRKREREKLWTFKRQQGRVGSFLRGGGGSAKTSLTLKLMVPERHYYRVT